MKSMLKLKNMQRALLAAGLIAATTGALANAVTTTFLVQATVSKQCTVSALGLTFPTVDPTSTLTNGTTTITVNCTKNTGYTVGLNQGATAGATIAQRLMANAGNTMQYNLYLDSGHATVWDNVSPNWGVGIGAGMGTAQTLTVYGQVAAGQTSLAAVNYTEPTITVTVTF